MMRIIDENGNEILNPDYSKGYTTEEEIFIAHHDAIPGVEEVWHYEVVREYPNGGKDVEKVIDVLGVPAQDAWDETEKILRYILYSEEELTRRAEEQAAKEAEEHEKREAEEALARENAKLKAQVAALMENQQFLEDCIAEMAEIVYA